MISAERKLVVTAAWTMTVLGAWSIAQHGVQAEEVQTPPRQVRVELKVTGPGVPGLEKIPIIGRLFVVNAKKDAECCDEKLQVADKVERIGVDFEPVSREVCAHDPSKLCCEKCDEVQLCPSCPAAAHAVVAAKAACNACSEVSCPACPFAAQVAATAKAACKACETSCSACPAAAQVVATAKVANNACQDGTCPAALSQCCKESEFVIQTAATECQCISAEHCQKTECIVSARFADLVAENTALVSALGAKEEMLALQTKMWERFAMLMTEKVHLQAQLSFSEKLLAERQKSMEKFHELAEENSRLKNMVEMAAVRHEVEQSKLELAQENQRLKARVTELELASREGHTEVRVAKKPRETKTEK